MTMIVLTKIVSKVFDEK